MFDTEFKYKTSFACTISSKITGKEEWLSKASIHNLKNIVPAFALEHSLDLLPIAFNSCVVNLGNENGDLIDTETAISVYKKFDHKPINIEHKRSQCVGHLIASALSSFNINYKEGFGSEILTEEEVIGKSDPFNISLAGFIYKVVDPELVDLIIEASNPLSDNHLKISASWELGFNDFDILLGSPLMSRGERITDPIRKQELIHYTKSHGGSGKYIDGQDVFRIIKGTVVPLGIGLTTTPAGAVQGIITISPESTIASNSTEGILEPQQENIKEILEEENIISQLNSNPVNIHSIMNFKEITDENLKTLTAAQLQDIFTKEVQASHKNVLADAIEAASNDYAAKLDEQKKIAEQKSTEVDTTKAALDELTQEFTKIKTELESEKQARANEKALSDFNSRMSTLAEAYNLTDKDREVIAKQIRGLDDESFSGWYSDWQIIAASKVKNAEPQQSQASIEAALDNLSPQTPSIPNMLDLTDAKAKWAQAWKVEDLVSRNPRK